MGLVAAVAAVGRVDDGGAVVRTVRVFLGLLGLVMLRVAQVIAVSWVVCVLTLMTVAKASASAGVFTCRVMVMMLT